MGRWYNTTFMGLMVGGEEQTYAEKVLSYGPIAYWPMWEAAGVIAECLVNSPAQDGAYTGVTLGQPGIGDGNTCPLFDGINDQANIITGALSAAMSWVTGSAVIWIRMINAGLWTDGTVRGLFEISSPGLAEVVRLERTAVNNQIAIHHVSNSAWQTRTTLLAGGRTDWMCWAQTWDSGANEYRAFLDGVQVGAIMTCAAPGGGATSLAWIGSQGGWRYHSGWAAHAQLYDTTLSPAIIADLATI